MRTILPHLLITAFSLIAFGSVLAQNLPTASQIERTNQLLDAQDRLNKIVQTPRSFYIENIALKIEGSCKKAPLEETIESYKNRWLTETDIKEFIESLKDNCDKKTAVSYHIKDNTLEIEIVDFQEDLD